MYILENIVDRIKEEFIYFGVAKKNRLSYYLKTIISNKTNFKINKIILIIAEKTKIKEYNEFNHFVFKYNGLVYDLLDNDLNVINDYEY